MELHLIRDVFRWHNLLKGEIKCLSRFISVKAPGGLFEPLELRRLSVSWLS